MNRFAQVRVGAAFMDKLDEVLIHRMADGGCLGYGLAVENILNIGVAPAVCNFRRKSAFDRSAGTQSNKNDL